MFWSGPAKNRGQAGIWRGSIRITVLFSDVSQCSGFEPGKSVFKLLPSHNLGPLTLSPTYLTICYEDKKRTRSHAYHFELLGNLEYKCEKLNWERVKVGIQ